MDVAATSPKAGYPNEVGPGVWDIHSPRVPGRRRRSPADLRRASRFPTASCGSTRTAA